MREMNKRVVFIKIFVTIILTFLTFSSLNYVNSLGAALENRRQKAKAGMVTLEALQQALLAAGFSEEQLKGFFSQLATTGGPSSGATTKAPPGLILYSPPDGAIINDATPTLDWSDATNAVKYHVQVDNDTDCSSPIIDDNTVSSQYTCSSLFDGIYYWRVQYQIQFEVWCDWSDIWSFTIDTVPPGVPSLVSPANGALINDNTPTLDWNAVSGANLYQVQVDNTNDFSSPIIDTTTSNSYYTTSTLGDTTLYWRVRARDAAGNWGGWCAPWHFTVDTTPPGAPSLISPSNGAITNDNTPTLTWSAPPGGNQYNIQVDTDNSFSSPDFSSYTTNTYITTSSLSDEFYFWRVRARDTAGNWGSWSSVWSFQIDTVPPGQAGVVSPSDGARINDNTPLLDWTNVGGANLYRLQLDNNIDFSSTIIDITTSATSYQITSTLSDGPYYWRVRARDAAGNWGSWSIIWDFVVDTVPPGQPTLVSPSDSALINDDTPYLDWSFVTGASIYQIQLDDNNDFSSTIIDTTTGNTYYQVTSPLSDDTYYWRVRARDAAGNWGSWSVVWTFQLDATPPGTVTLDAPVNGTVTNDATVALSWFAVTTAVGYQIMVDNNIDFSSPIIDDTTVDLFYTTSSLSDGTYFWRVRARDTAGNWGGWSEIRAFEVDTVAPAAPVLSSPANHALIMDNTPQLEWNTVTGATLYEVQLDNDADFSSPIVSSTTSNAYYIVGTLADGTYFWRVRARDAAGNWGSWSSVWDLEIDTVAPGQVTLDEPANDVILGSTPTLYWDTLSEAVNYQLQLDDDVDFSSLIVNIQTTETSYLLATLSDGTYYWRVRGQDAAGNWGEWSEVWHFHIDTAVPTTPVNENPVNETITSSSTVSFDWTEIVDAVEYQLQVSLYENYSSLVINLNVTTAYYTAVSLADGTYFWHVRARDIAGNWGNWSSTSFFVVDTGSPVIENISHMPSEPLDGQTVVISCNATDENGIRAVKLYYRKNQGQWILVEMTLVAGTNYQATIGPFSYGDEIEYYLLAEDNADSANIAIEDNSGNYYSFVVVTDDTTPPTLDVLGHAPENPITNDLITVTCVAVDANGIQLVQLFYRLVGTTSWMLVNMTNTGGNVYEATLGRFNAGDTIEYYIVAYDNSVAHNKATDNNGGVFYKIDITQPSTSSSGPTLLTIIIPLITVSLAGWALTKRQKKQA